VTPDVSVCIATCGRPRGLERLLASLARQKLPGRVAFEVLVVDNGGGVGAQDAPADATAGVIERFGAALPLRAFAEPRRNIARARNRALDAARGRWLAFVDDDEEACEGWLAAFLERAEEGDADGWFGPVLPRPAAGAPAWLAGGGLHARPRHASGALLPLAALSTSNACLRAALLAGRRFDPAFGRSGGSDTELFGRLLRAGARFRWCDEARVCELLPPERLRLAWLARRAFRGGVVTTRLERRFYGSAAAWLRGGPRALAGLGLFGAALPAAALCGRARAARVLLRACTQAGHLWALLGRDFEEYGGGA
jgi:hypothetical protein